MITNKDKEMLGRSEHKGINLIIDMNDCHFHRDERGVPTRYTNQKVPKQDQDCGYFKFKRDFRCDDESFRFVRLIVPNKKILYYVRTVVCGRLTSLAQVTHHLPCHLALVRDIDSEDLTDPRSQVPHFDESVAFFRCHDGLVFYHHKKGCVVCQTASGGGLTEAQLAAFDHEFSPSFHHRALLDREIDRITMIVGRRYYQTARPASIVGDSRPREMFWLEDIVHVDFAEVLLNEFDNALFQQFLVLELRPNSVAIVGPVKLAEQTKALQTTAWDEEKRLEGFVEYRQGIVALNLTTSRLYGIWSSTNMPLHGDTVDEPFTFEAETADSFTIIVEVTADYYISNAVRAVVGYIGTISRNQAGEVQARDWYDENISRDIKPIVANAFRKYIKRRDRIDVCADLMTGRGGERKYATIEARDKIYTEMEQDIRTDIDRELAERGLTITKFIWDTSHDKSFVAKVRKHHENRMDLVAEAESGELQEQIHDNKLRNVGKGLPGGRDSTCSASTSAARRVSETTRSLV